MWRSKNIRLHTINYRGQQSYFVTICCFRRRQIFIDMQRGEGILNLFRGECASRNFAAHAYCLMPDHFHFLVEGLDVKSDLLNLVKSLKIKSSRTFGRQTRQVLWQRKFYDHILRPHESVESVAWYIWSNPLRKGLAREVGMYPLAGSFTMPFPPRNSATAVWAPPWRPVA
jgi:putative transposase